MTERAHPGLPEGFVPAVPLERTLDGVLGLETVLDELPDGPVRGRLQVREALCRPRTGVLHGGVLCAIAESLASIGTLVAVAAEGKAAMGLSNETSFLRPFVAGHVHAEARAVHRGRGTWVWTVDLRDDEGRLGAAARVTVAVR